MIIDGEVVGLDLQTNWGVEMSGTAVEEDSEIRPFRVEVREEELAELGKVTTSRPGRS
jgi:hypothetical protein